MKAKEARAKAKEILVSALSTAYYKLENEDLTIDEIEAITFYINKYGNTMAKSINETYYTM